MTQVLSAERVYINSIEQCLSPLDPDVPPCPESDCEDEVVANLQEYLSSITADAISDADLKTKVQNRGTLQEFAAELKTDLNIVLP